VQLQNQVNFQWKNLFVTIVTKLEGLQADSVILTHQKRGNTPATLYVNSVIYGHALTIVYDDAASEFDQNLPTVNKMIDSIAIGAGL